MARMPIVGRARRDSLNPLGEPNKPRQSVTSFVVPENVGIQRFECSAEARQRIQDVTGAVLLQAQIHNRVRLQAGNAASLAKKAATRLQTVDDTLSSIFHNVFGVEANSPPSWAPRGGWTHARIVQQRFLGAHKHLKTPSLLYSCWGRPRGAGPEVNPDYLALALPGKYWIALGRRYWQADQDKDFDTTTYALLLAALRAYYGPLLSNAPLQQAPLVRKIGNIHCYAQFVADVFNLNLPDWVEANCPKSA
jgi:hypothetical protein